MNKLLSLLAGDPMADRVVPPSGFTARLTVLAAGAMAFLAVFALALTFATGRVASRWSEELARTSTLRISAPTEEVTARALRVLGETPGVATARALTDDEQSALLEPWFGADLPLDALPVPQLIEITATREGYDATGLNARLKAEVPGALLDDHSQWRQPLVRAAGGLRLMGWMSLLLILATTAAIITLAAGTSLAANTQVIKVLRLVGAKDTYIARAFVRRFTIRALIGAAGGTLLAMVAIALLPQAQTAEGFLTGIGFRGFGWVTPIVIPPLAAAVAFAATRFAALRTLRGLS